MESGTMARRWQTVIIIVIMIISIISMYGVVIMLFDQSMQCVYLL